MEEEFRDAVEHVSSGPRALSEDTQRKLFGLFQRATCGMPPDEPSASLEAEQLAAWRETEGLSQADAMREYVNIVSSDESFLFYDDVKCERTVNNEPQDDQCEPQSHEVSDVFDAVRKGFDLTPFLPDGVSAIDDCGLSVLHHAVDAEQTATVEVLLEANAVHIDAVDGQKATALHYAALLGSEPIVTMLLSAGATALFLDEDGKSAAQLAHSEGHTALAMLIEEAATTAAGAAAGAVTAGATATGAAAVGVAAADSRADASLPVIDIGAFMSGSEAERACIAASFDEAFCTVGFCQISGYDGLLAKGTVSSLREQASHFFALPADAKRRTRVDGLVGYLGPGEESVSDSSAVDATDAALPSGEADPVESLNLPGYQEEGATWRSRAAEAECPWARAPWMASAPEELRSAALAYWGGATRLMNELMVLMACALDLPANFFESAFESPGTLLRLAWYPAIPAVPTDGSDGGDGEGGGGEGGGGEGMGSSSAQLRYGEHTDYDGFTILQRSGDDGGFGGLQIQMPSGEWTSVPSPNGTLTINIGDLFARWTNDRWRATKHRVAGRRPSSSADLSARLSIVYFSGPHPDTVVQCLPSPKCQREAPRYEPITAGAHVEAKMRAATAAARSLPSPLQ